MPWVYAESLVEDIKLHVESTGGFTRNVNFWHDLHFLDGVNVRLLSGEHAPHVTFQVFQNLEQPVAEKPTIWIYGLLSASTESEAYAEAKNIPARVISLVSLALRIPLRASGDSRIIKVAETEHGWLPHFDGSSLVGIDVLESPPVVNEDGREYEARRYIPYHQPTLGSITNDNNLSIYFQDVMRQVDHDTDVSVEHQHIEIEQFNRGVAWLGINCEEGNILHLSMPYYASALSQSDPVLQFLLLWNFVEQIINSVESEKLLTDEQVNNMLDSENLEGQKRERVKGALKQLTDLSFRDKVKSSFEATFGSCKDDADKRISDLRAKRSSIVHPRPNASNEVSITTYVNELREIVEIHLDLIRDQICAES